MRRLFQFTRRSTKRIRTDVDDELRFHIDARAEALAAAGMPPDQARREAEREFGDVDDARRYLNDIDRRTEKARRRRDYMGEFRQDLVYALRALRAAPAFAVTAILTLALGIGANTAIFSVVDAVLLRGLPYPKPEQLLTVWSANQTANNLRGAVSAVDVDDWRAQKGPAVADVGAWFYQPDGGSGINYLGGEQPERLSGVFFTPGFFTTFGLAPEAGRLPREDEMVRGGSDKVVVLSHRFWMRQFNGSRAAIGTSLTLGGAPYQVVGVMPASFRVPVEDVDVYIPYSTIPDNAIPRLRQVRILDAVARVADGHTAAEANTALEVTAKRLAQQYPENASYDGVTTLPLRESMTGKVQSGLYVLLGAVAFVLLMACVNVASLLLARGAARQGEIAIRAALGAGRGRLVRQLLTESLVLALVGGALGLGFAKVGVGLLLKLSAGQLPRAAEVRLDGTVLLFALGVSLLTGLLFGLVPAIRIAGVPLQATLKAGGRGNIGGGQRLRNALVVTEIALAVVLVVGAGLMTRSFVALMNTDPGFRPDHLVAVNFSIDAEKERGGAHFSQVYRDIIDRARTLPGAVSAGAVKNAPFRGSGERNTFVIPGAATAPGSEPPVAIVMHISDGYFKTIGAAMKEGREFTLEDTRESPRVLVVNEAFAKKYFPRGDAVGTVLNPGGFTLQIVGVVNDIRQTSMDQPVEPTAYINNMQNSRVKTTLVVRTRGEPLAMARQIREMIWSIDRGQTINSIFTFDDVVGEALARPRLLTVLLGLFGVLGLLLGTLGIYGLLAYLVNQRRREIGVRIALGADTRSVLRMFVGRGVGLAAGGVAIGLVVAFGVTRIMRGVLYGVGPTDPLTFAAVALILVAVAAVASWIPARRAAGVDPVLALRSD